MGLYLCVFDADEEIEGVEVGSYADFNAIRDYIVKTFEDGIAGSKFPTFIFHFDSDGEWKAEECGKLQAELHQIAELLKTRPPLPFGEVWQQSVARSIGLAPINAFESIIDVDGEFLLNRLEKLVDVALKRRLPILFQ
jgi:hypothetical protein